MTKVRWTHLIAALFLAAIFAACGSSSSSNDDKDTVSVPDTTGGTDTAGTPVFKKEDFIGTSWRFTELVAAWPKNSGSLLNGVWKSDIRWCDETAQVCCDHPSSVVGPITTSTADCTGSTPAGTLVDKSQCSGLKLIIMMNFLALDGEKLTLEAGSGDIEKLLATGKSTWFTKDPEDPNKVIEPAKIENIIKDDGTFTTSQVATFFFPTSATNKAIPIKKLKVEGSIKYVADVRPEEGCRLQGTQPVPGWLIEGKMSGVITVVDAMDLLTTLIPGQSKSLHWVLDNFNDEPNESLNDDGKLDSYRFEGTFKARMIQNFAATLP